MKPKVSVIMNSYQNKNCHLNAAIDSYLKQKDVDVQLIISTVANDPAVDIAGQHRVDIVVSDKPGIFQQINKALKLISGAYYAYASGNDVALPTKLIDEVNLLDGRRVCYSAFYHTNEDLKIIKAVRFKDYNYKDHLIGNYVSDCAMMTVDTINEFMPFIVKYETHAYWDMWLRIAEKYGGKCFVYNQKPEWLYRIMKDSRHIRKITDVKLRKSDELGKKIMLRDHGA